jgi:DNA-binding response OmpR family regulator
VATVTSDVKARMNMRTILLVEDNPNILESLQNNLETDGYQVFVAMRAAQALALAASQAPDLIILDIELPDRDGYHVLEELRKHDDHSPVLILSARNLESDKLQGFRLGADDYVTKPFSIMELLARISALLRRAGNPAAPVTVSAFPTFNDDDLRARFGLTARQIAVARLVGEGCSNAEIARRLEMSYFTARNHTEQVLQKLRVSNRAAVGAVIFGGSEPLPVSAAERRQGQPLQR